MLTQEELRKTISIAPETGTFFRTFSRQRPDRAGQPTGVRYKNGYIYVSVLGKRYLAHRLVWLWVHGRWPAQIDHIDGCRTNNAISNLREATPTENSGNRYKNRNNRSGFKGVVPVNGGRQWGAQLCVNGRRTHLGSWPLKEQAAAAYDWAASQHFGQFAGRNGDVHVL